jgi:hypothetical protein
MYVERIPNRNSPPAILLRESYREGNKIKKRTLANLSAWPAAKIEALRCVLREDAVAPIKRALRRPSSPLGSTGSPPCGRRAIQELVEAGAIRLSLFDQRDLAEITAPDYPGERLVVCRNPLLAEVRARKRRELIDACNCRSRAARQTTAARQKTRSGLRSAP